MGGIEGIDATTADLLLGTKSVVQRRVCGTYASDLVAPQRIVSLEVV